jgi:hypothetical protein
VGGLGVGQWGEGFTPARLLNRLIQLPLPS